VLFTLSYSTNRHLLIYLLPYLFIEIADDTSVKTTGGDRVHQWIRRKGDVVAGRNVIKQVWKQVARADDVRVLSVLGEVHDVQVTHLVVVCRAGVHRRKQQVYHPDGLRP